MPFNYVMLEFIFSWREKKKEQTDENEKINFLLSLSCYDIVPRSRDKTACNI